MVGAFRPAGTVNCVYGAVSAQCGEESAQYARTFLVNVLDIGGCTVAPYRKKRGLFECV